MKTVGCIISGGSLVALALMPLVTFAHGDVTPQPIDTKTLAPLGAEWRDQNPYSGQKEPIRIGTSAYAEKLRALPWLASAIRRHRPPTCGSWTGIAST